VGRREKESMKKERFNFIDKIEMRLV